MDMTSIMALSWAGKLGAAVVAALCVFALLRWFDLRAGIDFKDFTNDIKTDPKAAGLYLGLRYLGTALLFGLVLAFS